jgi:hypothetical protein
MSGQEVSGLDFLLIVTWMVIVGVFVASVIDRVMVKLGFWRKW